MTDPRRFHTNSNARAARGSAPRLRALYALALLVPLVMGARDCERVVVGQECDGGPCEPDDGCFYAGENHAVGESFPSEDGCNSCSCSADGVACTERACVDTICGGLTGGACPAGQYCHFPEDAICGAADATGICEEKPELCTQEYSPVCGCDDRTYGNACEAAAAGVSVATHGECGSGSGGGTTCGGLLGSPCPAGEYCNFPADALCGAADQTGTCTPKPDVCPAIYQPVCGCDDHSYGNACEAAGAGVSVAHAGECETGSGGAGSGQSCGGLLGSPCPTGEYCNFPEDALCGAADATGTCAAIPSSCTLEYSPVCGCDDNTYGNACAAAAAGVSVVRAGECGGGGGPGSGQTCGGLLGSPCPSGEYCNFPIDALCGAADATGTCATKPDACDAILAPVCGCDDMTYSSDCVAASSGISVQHPGECN